MAVALFATCAEMVSYGAAAATCTDTSANRSQQISDFCKNALAIESYIKDLKTKSPDAPLPDEVQDKMNALSAIAPPDKLLTDTIGIMNKLLEHDDLLQSDANYAALTKLSADITAKISRLNEAELTARMALVQTFVSDGRRADVFQIDAVHKSASALWETLGLVLYNDADLLANVKGNADRLIALIKMATPQLAADALKTKPDTVDELKALRGEIDKITGLTTPRVHIFYAYYGDIRGSARSDRICDATAAMRKACEAKPNCNLPDGFETTLCGYDPAPFIEKRDRGVFVSYGCQKGGEDKWTRNVTEQHGTLMSVNAPRPVVVQSKEMEIACAKIPE
jgi:hypothetical protein